MLEKLFKLKKYNTTVGIEVTAGLTTFMTMAYIIALNPNLITNFGAGTPDSPASPGLWNAVFLATVLSAGIGTLIMAFLANRPFALAPGMGLNSYFATVVATICGAAGFETYEEGVQAGLSIILVSGILFTILTILKIREKIVDAIPQAVRLGIPAGIGFMLVNIGLGSNAGIFTENGEFRMLGSFFTDGPSATKAAMGDEAYTRMILYVVSFFIGLFVIATLACRKIKASILIGMAASAGIYWAGVAIFLKENPFISLINGGAKQWLPDFGDMAKFTLFKFDFEGLFEIGVFSAIMTIISFCMVDMFDTIGTLYGTAKKANMLDKDGNLPEMSKAMLSDSIATCVGACTGTSTVTTFVESASGVEAGGRTGLASVVTGFLFLACMFISPIAAIIPAPATSAALVYVGVLMMGSLKEVDYEDVASTVPVILLLIFMVQTSGIGNGIGIGLIAYSIIKLCTGKGKEVSILTYILALLFIGKFFITF
ncbi:MAG: NCS2 family permease [Lachnospiraceae bacterium]|nr:NCS2 family permease [Lachnospiraceae bacterium]